jgi:metal-responsive CopG/Arc/MetJ family transcriptional regulator
MVKRVSISLDKEQLKLLDSVMGFGTKEAEKVKNIMIAYLSEKGYLQELNKKRGQ